MRTFTSEDSLLVSSKGVPTLLLFSNPFGVSFWGSLFLSPLPLSLFLFPFFVCSSRYRRFTASPAPHPRPPLLSRPTSLSSFGCLHRIYRCVDPLLAFKGGYLRCFFSYAGVYAVFNVIISYIGGARRARRVIC